MSTESTLRARLGRPEQDPVDSRNRSGTPVRVELRAVAELSEPVSVADALRRFGLGLREARRVLDELKERGVATVQLYVSESSGRPEDLDRFALAVSRTPRAATG